MEGNNVTDVHKLHKMGDLVDKDVTINPKATVQNIKVSELWGRIMTPFRMIISGPTLAGKSQFCKQLIKHRNVVFDKEFTRVLYAIPEESAHLHQEFIEELRKYYNHLEIVEGLPNLSELQLRVDQRPKLIIIDDLMTKVFSSESMLHLVTQDSHHCNCSVVITCQNVFFPGKYTKSFLRNASEKVFFFDKTDSLLLSIISRHMFPSQQHFLKRCFEWIYENRKDAKLKYLLVDSSSLSRLPTNALVRTFIFPENDDSNPKPVYFFPDERTK